MVLLEVKFLTMHKHAIVVIVLFNIGIFTVLFFSLSIKNLYTALIIFNLIPLLYFNLPFHYSLRAIIIQDIPFLLLFGVFFFKSLSQKGVFRIELNYVELPFVIFGFYIFFMTVLGFFNNHTSLYIADEFWHSIYYLGFFVLSTLLKQKKEYEYILYFLLILSVLISIELVFFSFYTDIERFVIFQSYILPLFFSIAISIFLFKNLNTTRKILFLTMSIIIGVGIFITLTRTVWVATLISLFILVAIYLVKKRNISKKLIFIILLLFMLPILFMGDAPKSKSANTQSYNDVEYRTQSVVNPTEDISFLMRIELTIYIIQEFLESPIIGKGFGDAVEYKILGITGVPIYYPDNSWLFFMWKGGIVGLLIFGWIYFRILRTSWNIAANTQDLFSKSIMYGIFAGLIGLAFLGLFNAVLIKYKTTLILPIIFAYVNFEYNRLLEGNKRISPND